MSFLKRLTLLGVCGLGDTSQPSPTRGKIFWDKKSYKKGLSGGGSGGALGGAAGAPCVAPLLGFYAFLRFL